MDEPDDQFAASVDEKIARNVRLARERAGLSQAELAAKLTEAGVAGIHQTTIARIEGGQRVLRLAEALALARFFEYQLEDWVESPASASLRAHHSYLQKAVTAFYDAANELEARRWNSAEYLDEKFPYTPDGSVIAVVTVDPRSFNLLDELLTTNSDPFVLAADIYRTRLANARLTGQVTPFTPGYAMDLYDEALRNYNVRPIIRDFTEASDREFEESVIVRFAAEST